MKGIERMYFECYDWLYGTYLTKVAVWQGIIILLCGCPDCKFVPWWKVIKDK